MITASGLNRAKRCIASIALPQQDSPSEQAEQGRAVARFLQRVTEVGAEVALAEVPSAYVDVCAGFDLEAMPTNMAAEVAWAYNVRTGEALELGRGIERDYHGAMLLLRPAAALDEWIFGTLDVFGVSDDAVFAGDHKSFTEEEPARTHLQVCSGAMALAKVHGKLEAVVAILRPYGNRRDDYASLDAFDLEDVEFTLSGIYHEFTATRAGALPIEPKPGSHCRYCKAAAACPVAGLAVKQVQAQALEKRPAFDWQAPVTRETAADWYKGLAAIKEWVNQRERAIYAMAREAPIPLGEGKVLGEREKPGTERIDPVVGYRVLLQHFGERIANDACERVFTKSGLEKALVAHGIKGRTKLEKAAYEDIRAAGGSKRTSKKVIEEYEP